MTVYETAGAGIKDFPITAVVPLPSGRYQTTLRFRLLGPSGQAVPAQFDVLERWWARDQSIRHLKIQFRADVTPYDDRHPNSGSAVYQLTDDGRSASAESPLQVRDESDHIER